MKVAIVAPSTRGAMGYHLQSLSVVATPSIELAYYVPHLEIERKDNIIVREYPITRNWTGKLISYFNPLWARRRFLEIKALEPDIVHLFNSAGYFSSLLWAKWIIREMKAPLIVSVHDPEPHPGLVPWVGRQIEKKTISYAYFIHIFSECFKKVFTDAGISPERVFVIPLMTNLSKFTMHKRDKIIRENLVLFFGRLEKYKGIEILIESSRILENQYRFVIAGPGKIPQRLRRRILEKPEVFDLRNYYLSEAEVADLFQRAAVCVMPYTQATQSSVPWLCAAFGTPLVATATGGIEHQAKLIGGIVVPPGDASALADGINRAVGIRVHMPKDWNPENIAQNYRHMYISVLDNFNKGDQL